MRRDRACHPLLPLHEERGDVLPLWGIANGGYKAAEVNHVRLLVFNHFS
jgi:hypothetical protein